MIANAAEGHKEEHRHRLTVSRADTKRTRKQRTAIRTRCLNDFRTTATVILSRPPATAPLGGPRAGPGDATPPASVLVPAGGPGRVLDLGPLSGAVPAGVAEPVNAETTPAAGRFPKLGGARAADLRSLPVPAGAAQDVA